MLHQIQRALEPDISLKTTIDNWNKIASWMADPPRKRRRQMEGLIEIT